MTDLRDALRRSGLLAILRSRKDAPLLDVLRTLADGGVRIMEVTLPSPGSLDAIERARDKLGGEVIIGAGTVLFAADVLDAVSAGAQFVVAPNLDREVVAAAHKAGVGVLPGAFTPTEIITAWQAAPTAVKVFPATSLGPRYIRDLAGPLPDVPLVPTGGVDVNWALAYRAAGALAVGVGSQLIGDALTGGSLAELRIRAVAFVRAVRT